MHLKMKVKIDSLQMIQITFVTLNEDDTNKRGLVVEFIYINT